MFACFSCSSKINSPPSPIVTAPISLPSLHLGHSVSAIPPHLQKRQEAGTEDFSAVATAASNHPLQQRASLIAPTSSSAGKIEQAFVQSTIPLPGTLQADNLANPIIATTSPKNRPSTPPPASAFTTAKSVNTLGNPRVLAITQGAASSGRLHPRFHTMTSVESGSLAKLRAEGQQRAYSQKFLRIKSSLEISSSSQTNGRDPSVATTQQNIEQSQTTACQTSASPSPLTVQKISPQPPKILASLRRSRAYIDPTAK